MNSLYDLLAELHPDKKKSPCLSFKHQTLNREELLAKVDQLASELQAQGIVPGIRVAIYLPKCPFTVISLLACAKLSLTVVPINPLLKATQCIQLMDDCQASVFISLETRIAPLLTSLKTSTVSTIVSINHIEDLDPNNIYHSANTAHACSAKEINPTHFGAAAILYTSGSTGNPKGVVLSHDNIILGAKSVAQYLQLTNNDTLLALLPLSFDYGLNQLTSALFVGAHVVLQDFLLANDTVNTIAQYKVTGLAGVPPLWHKLAAAKWTDDAIQGLRYFTNSGGALPTPLLDKLRHLLPNAQPYLMYGLTEAFRSTYLSPSDIDNYPTSIGKAIPNAEVFIINAQGVPTKPFEHGELVHCGPLVSLGYWGSVSDNDSRFKQPPNESKLPSFTGNAVWSGDTVFCDNENYIYFVGRQDDMIKTSGYRVSTDEIEAPAYRITGILEAVAVGVEHALIGQEIILCVTIDKTHDTDLYSDLKSRNDENAAQAIKTQLAKELPTYMIPATVLIVDNLPRNPNGKFDRKNILQSTLTRLKANRE